jgi:hypothetical protein
MGTDTDVEDQTSTENVEMSDEILDGTEYVGEDDFGPAKADPELKDFGMGAIIASIHVDEESEEDEVIYMATMAMPTNSKPDDIKVAAELMKSIKEDYEVWGSGLKPQPIGKTNQQLKVNSTKEWASNSNIKPIESGNSDKPQIQ